MYDADFVLMEQSGRLCPDGARPPGIAKQSATTESDIAVSIGVAGTSWPRANHVDSAAVTAAVKSGGKARHPGIAKQCATTKPELAESSGGAGPSWPKASGMNSAAAAAAVKSSGEARPPGIAKYGATKESELAVSRRRLLEELFEQFERELGYRVEFSERIFDALS